jgi:presenilin-like A22 family membrane protease
MKHRPDITVFILIIFFLTQAFGLGLLAKEAEIITTVEDDVTIVTVSHGETAIGERPQTEGFSSFALIVVVILVSTGLFLLIVKFAKHKLWKTWFFLAVWLSVTVSLGVFFNIWIAYLVSLILTLYKLSGRSVFIYNLGEILMYSGIGLIFAPMFDLLWVFVLLITISLYDMYAVWKSKHMVKMAEFQRKSKLFAGIAIPYHQEKGALKKMTHTTSVAAKTSKSRQKLAILGGGDVVFPLIFAGAVLEFFISKQVPLISAYFLALVIAVFSLASLALLFYKSEENKFYPAMPFISAGCFIGFVVSYLIFLI